MRFTETASHSGAALSLILHAPIEPKAMKQDRAVATYGQWAGLGQPFGQKVPKICVFLKCLHFSPLICNYFALCNKLYYVARNDCWKAMRSDQSLTAILDAAERTGKLNLRIEEIRAALPNTSPEALRQSLDRQRRRGRIVRPSRGSGHWLIVPLQYAAIGAPPLESWLHHYLSKTLKIPYYVALLSGAEVYGASPYAVTVTQVMVAERRRPIQVGRHRIVFHTRLSVEHMPTRWHETPDGRFLVSSPEMTAIDLVQREEIVGGISRIREALRGLWSLCTPSGLIEALDAAESTPVAQRLGALLAMDGQTELAASVLRWLNHRPTRPVPLESHLHAKASHKDPNFKVRIPDHLQGAGT